MKKNTLRLIILFCLVSGYIIIFSYTTILQHNRYNTTLYDLGTYDQIIWNMKYGRFFECSLKGFNFLGDHFVPIILLLYPLYFIWSNVRMLLFVQTVILASGAFPFYLIAKKEFEEKNFALLFAFTYLCYPALGYLNMFDFHEISIAVPLLAWSFYFLKTDKWKLFYAASIAALLCKEEIGLIIFFLGIFIIIDKKNYRHGMATASLGILYFVLVTLFIIPIIRGGQYIHFSRYAYLGDNLGEISKTCLLHPLHILRISFSLRKLFNLIFIFLSLGFTPLFSPFVLLPAIPPMLYSYLSPLPSQFDIRYHYTAPIIPFLIFASLYGIKNILNWQKKHFSGYKIAKNITVSSFLIIITSCSFVQVLIPLRPNPLKLLDYHDSILKASEFIDTSSSLTAGNSLCPHFSQRREIKQFLPDTIPSTDFILLDLNRDYMWGIGIDELFSSVKKIIASGGYGIIYFKKGILVMEKGKGTYDLKPIEDFENYIRNKKTMKRNRAGTFVEELINNKSTTYNN